MNSFIIRDYQQALIDQTLNSIAYGNNRILIQSPAGSGKSVTMAEIAKRSTDKGKRVLFVVHRRELVTQIKRTFKTHGVNENLCQIGMVQTITNRLNKIAEPTLIIVDEAHHALAKTYKRIFNHFPNAFIVGCTATPIRLSGAGLGEVFDDLIIGQSVKWLIDNNRLAPYEYYSIDLTDHQALKRASTGDFTHKSMDKALGSTIYGDIVKHYEKLATGKKAIAYCHSVDASKQLAEQFNQAGIPAKQVDAKTHKTEREQAMNDFIEGKIKVLTNADLYGEGVDVPDCSVVILARPTQSLSLYIQQSMRPMRYRPNKTATIIDHVGNCFRHGLPDEEHQWSLEGKKQNDSEQELKIKQCPSCGRIVLSKEKSCDGCGYVFVIEGGENEKEVDKTAELVLITEEEVNQRRLKNKHWKKAKSYRELLEMAKAKGYKQSWAGFKAYDLELPDTPSWVIKLKQKETVVENDDSYQLDFGYRLYQ